MNNYKNCLILYIFLIIFCLVAGTISAQRINPIPNGNVCSGQDYTYSGPANSSFYQWTVTGGATFSGQYTRTITVRFPSSGFYTITVEYDNNDDVPRSTIYKSTCVEGGTVSPLVGSFCGSGTGTLVLNNSYGNILRWESSTDEVTWNSIANTSTTLNFSNLLTTTSFRAIVGTSCGSSSISKIYIDQPVQGGSIEGSGKILCGSPVLNKARLTSVGRVGNIVRWESTTDGGASWTVVQAGGDYIEVSPPQTTQYRVLVISSNCGSAYSSWATVTVYPLSVGGTLSGSNSFYYSGSGTMSLTGHVGSIVTWEKSEDNGGSWSALPNTAALTSYSYNITKTTLYRVLVQSNTCNPAYSGVATVKVSPVGGSVTGTDRVIAPTNNGTVQLNGYSGTTFAWESSTNGITWSLISGANASSYTFNNLTTNTWYRAIVSNVLGEKSTSSSLLVIAEPAAAVEGTYVNNYTQVETVLKRGVVTETDLATLPITYKNTVVQYTDGMGRAVQQVVKQGSVNQKDLVQTATYDNLGRASTSYLPFESLETNYGDFKTYALAKQSSFYNDPTDKIADDVNPYAVTRFDNSPLQLVTEQGAPGQDWQPITGHSAKSIFRTNIANEVRLWNADGTSSGYYTAGELAAGEGADENGNKTITFADKAGNVILKKTQLGETIEGALVDYLETYYIYNDEGNLKYTIQPKCVAELKKTTGTWTLTTTLLDQWAFAYVYDAENRLVEMKKPGAAAEYLVYDQLGRLVMKQDGRLRATNQWYFTKYDINNRAVVEGICTNTATKSAIQSQFDKLNYAATDKYYEERKAGTTHGYTNQTLPVANESDILAVNYYDDYDFDYNGTRDAVSAYKNQGLGTDEPAASDLTRFATTSVKSRILGSSNWRQTIMLYDEYGKSIQQLANNHLNLTVEDVNTLAYDDKDQIKKFKQYQKIAAGKEITVINRFEYDQGGNVVKVYQQNNTDAEQQVGSYNYNALNQLVEKNLHFLPSSSTYLQSVDYRYNIRGWLTSINNSSLSNDIVTNDDTNDVFGLNLIYNKAESGLGNTLYYNGNVSAVKWKVNDVNTALNPKRERSYKLDYDKADQLKNALFQARNTDNSWTAEAGAYDEKNITYDHNGNIKTLQRFALLNGTTSITKIDELTYDYAGNGNRLKKVDDAGSTAYGFTGAVSQTEEYTYDANGNLLTDVNKGISITYNELNKTKRVTYTGGSYIEYTYDAAGTRLKKQVVSGSTTKTFDYIGGFVYENTILAYFPMPEGRVRNTGGATVSFEYEYFITDHQGNVRVSFINNGGVAKIRQENHFYPFGLSMPGQVINTPSPSPANKQLYNEASELQDDLGEQRYSTFYREYDPVLGRFNAVDPKADKYSSLTPYNYGFNDPIYWNDPDGDDGKPNRGHTALSLVFYNGGDGGGDYSIAENYGSGVKDFEDWSNITKQMGSVTQLSNYSALNSLFVAAWNVTPDNDVRTFTNIGGGKFEYAEMFAYGYFYGANGVTEIINGAAGSAGMEYRFIAVLSNEKSQTGSTKMRGGFDVDNAVAKLNENANSNSLGKCAKYVRFALEAGGADTKGHPVSAKDYDSFLLKKGFQVVNSNNYTAIKGDIAVMEAFQGANKYHIHGHIEMYNGIKWISDFKQREFWPGKDYREFKPKFTILRW